MYTSWGFRIEQASSGMFLSGIVEMTARLSVATGALLLWGLIRADLAVLLIVAIAGLVLAGMVFLVVSVLRSEERARSVGARIDRIVKWVLTKFKRQAPEDVIDRILRVRLEARDVLGRRWPIALAAALLGQAIAYAMLLTSIRAVGIDSSVLSWSDILFGQAIVALVTLIPITPGSVGIAELAFVGVYTAIAGKEYSDAIAAGVILYRLAVWLLPIPIGWLVTLHWQSETGNRLFGGSAED